jgi:hypothetical protein
MTKVIDALINARITAEKATTRLSPKIYRPAGSIGSTLKLRGPLPCPCLSCMIS